MLNNSEQSLTQYPNKARVPMQKMVEVGHLTDETLQNILRLSGFSNNRNELLGHAVSYLGLVKQNIPVDDCLRMAQELGLRVCPSWSPRRWRHEHNRLSRAMTMKTLSEKRVEYDVADYRSALPDAIPGYMIPSSRRLGMEGLRQKHCVASYHDVVVSGRYAFAAVFVANRRWTVKLALTGLPDSPLYMADIKGKRNMVPDESTRKAVLERLGIVENRPPERRLMDQQYEVTDESHEELLRESVGVLRPLGIEKVTASCAGYGDSGEVEKCEYEPAEAADEFKSNDRTEWNRVDGLLNAIVEETFTNSQSNWYNDEGGYGKFELDVVRGRVAWDVYYNFTESEVGDSDEYELFEANND